ncbi:MAG: hypothetical protein RLP15_12955 [Cryomorphaceae bacterium]
MSLQIGFGSVCLSQLYSNGYTTISGTDVGIGTDDPQAKLEVKHDVIPPATCVSCLASPASDEPAIRIKTEVHTNPPVASGGSSFYTWDINSGEELEIVSGTGSGAIAMLKLSNAESAIGGEEVLLSDDFHFSKQTGSTSFNYTIGLGARVNGGLMTQTTSGQGGGAIQNHNGTLRLFTGIGLNTAPLPRMTITNNGRVGIGTTNPTSLFEVKNGDVEVDNGGLQIKNGDVEVGNGELLIKNGRIAIGNAQGVNQFEVKSTGYVVAREILVDINETIPDYVFRDDYSLLSMEELRRFIQKENHLPNIPSAAEFEAIGGIELGELSRLLLEKQEELVLYILELEERLTELETSNSQKR